MKTIFTLLTLVLLSVHMNAQGFDPYNQPNRYDVNITYQPSYTTMYASALMEKKRQYDEGFKRVQDKLDEIAELPNKLWGVGKVPQDKAEQSQKLINWLTTNINKSNFDYANYSDVSEALKYCRIVENSIFKLYRDN